MTPAGFKTRLLIKIGEVGSGFFDDTTLNGWANSAQIKLFDLLVEQYGTTKKITRELQQFITTTAPITPTNATVDISPTSTDVPGYYSDIKVLVTSPYRTGTLTRTATIKDLNDLGPYNVGTPHYPLYDTAANAMTIEPSDVTSVTIVYFVVPDDIDVADNSTELPYNDKTIDRWIMLTMEEAGFANRDPNIVGGAAQDSKENP